MIIDKMDNAVMRIKTLYDSFSVVVTNNWSNKVTEMIDRVIVTCGAMLMSGQAALLAILILSDREEVAAWAQQLPQY